MAQQHHPFLNWEGIGQVRPLRPRSHWHGYAGAPSVLAGRVGELEGPGRKEVGQHQAGHLEEEGAGRVDRWAALAVRC